MSNEAEVPEDVGGETPETEGKDAGLRQAVVVPDGSDPHAILRIGSARGEEEEDDDATGGTCATLFAIPRKVIQAMQRKALIREVRKGRVNNLASPHGSLLILLYAQTRVCF